MPPRHCRPFMTPLRTVLILGLLLAGCQQPQEAPSPPPPPEVATVTARPQEILLTTELPGRTSPYRVAQIRPQVNGLIEKRLFTEGADVTAGEVLYQIDPASFRAALSNARAALRKSEANLPAIRTRVERYKELLESNAVSQQEYDDAAAALKQAEADVAYWEATVETARINLAYTQITAPISGRIGRSQVTEGAIVTAYQPMALATIQQLDPIYVDVAQSTTELLRLKRRLSSGVLNPNGEQQKAVQLILEDGTPYAQEGVLQFQEVTVDPSTGSVILRAVFPNPDGVLLPHMFVRAVMQEGLDAKALLSPQQAVARDPKGNPMAMIVGPDRKVAQRMLTVDRAVGDKWLVTAGIAEGDRVIVEGLQKVRPGIQVKAVPLPANEAGGSPPSATPKTADSTAN